LLAVNVPHIYALYVFFFNLWYWCWWNYDKQNVSFIMLIRLLLQQMAIASTTQQKNTQ